MFLVLEQFGRYGIGLVLKFGDTVLARIVHLLHQYIVDENIKLMALPLAYAPVFQTEAQVCLSACLHQVTEIMAVAGITEEDIVGISHL